MAKAIMIQGTMSNAGKSLFTAGLCRIFKQDGYSVAPFKAQNMALNSYITKDGLEMGRAQVVQAEAAGIEPSVHMNPILLKPTSHKGSQVIVGGEVLGTMTASEYFGQKTKLVSQVMNAYHTLAEQYDILVIEGAGSPAEINLKDQDLVNMAMAIRAKAPVILVADIDRGGVFASIYGTVMLLEDDEKKMIKGIIINKFRGELDTLQPGLRMIEAKIDVPVLGVIPYLQIDIEDEDCLTERILKEKAIEAVDIAVIRLPRMSNFTDFNVFEIVPGVSLRYVKSVAELKKPDMIILPGTKNTMGDLLWLRQSGLEAEIKNHAVQGTVIFGICGGYQMLGQTLMDPEEVEHGGILQGMELLDSTTIFAQEKRRIQVTGRFKKLAGVLAKLTGVPFSGYEIHMGNTQSDNDKALTVLDGFADVNTTKVDGCYNENVFGSYVHGIFDDERVHMTIIECLNERKGLKPSGIKQMSFNDYKDHQYDILAEALRKSVDMEYIYRILEAGI